MLNQTFPPCQSDDETESARNYVLPTRFSRSVMEANLGFDSGVREHRTQSVFTEELWGRVDALGLGALRWNDLDVMDVCCGAGFLSYHLLQRATPRTLTCVDISPHEVASARELLGTCAAGARVRFEVDDVFGAEKRSGAFDVIIGNSFLHHFSDVGGALERFRRMLRPGGVFATLHEPAPGAVALESRNPRNWLRFFRHGPHFIERLRPRIEGDPPSIGADVWLFEQDDLRDLCLRTGFRSAVAVHQNFLRPLVCAVGAMHLDEARPKLPGWKARALGWATKADRTLQPVLPASWYASVAVAART